MRWLSLLIVILVVLTPHPALAQTEQPPFEFVDASPLVISTQDHTEQVLILNNTAADLDLTLSLSELLPVAGKAATATSPFSLVGESGLRRLPAAGQIVVQVRVSDITLEAGSYGVYLTASTVAHVTRLQIMLTVKTPAAPKGRLSSTVDAWTAQLTQYPQQVMLNPLALTWGGDWSNAALPVQMTGVVSLPTGVLGTLAGSNGGAVEVRASQLVTSAAGWLSMPLTMTTTLIPGNYTGTIKISNDSAVKFTLMVAHHWVMPLIVVFVTVLLISYFINRYNNVLNRVWLLRERLENAYRTLSTAQKGQVNYRLTGLDSAHDADVACVRKLATASKLDTAGDEYKGALARIVALEACAATWRNLAKTLPALDSALKKLVAGLPAPPQDTEPASLRFVDDARKWLVDDEMTLADWQKRSAELSSAASLAATWLKLYNDADIAWKCIQDHKPEPGAADATRAQWDTDLRMAQRLRVLLWQGDAGQLNSSDTGTQVAAIKQTANGWSGRVGVPPTGIPKTLVDVESRPEQGCMPAVLVWLMSLQKPRVESAPSSGESVRRWFAQLTAAWKRAGWRGAPWKLRRWLGGALTFIIAAFVAAAAALSQVYFGKPFGTLVDYVNLVAWAAGVNAVVGGVLTALDKMLLRKDN